MRKITIDLDDEKVAFLMLLAKHGGGGDTLESVIDFVVYSVVDGMRRPGSWERPMVVSMFGEDWTEKLRPDPDVPYRYYPIGFAPPRRGGKS